jgi:hypothetical protein
MGKMPPAFAKKTAAKKPGAKKPGAAPFAPFKPAAKPMGKKPYC